MSAIQPIATNGIGRLTEAISSNGASNTDPSAHRRGFAATLERVLDDTNAQLSAADREAATMVVSEGANIHETMVALEKADIALRLTTRIGQKLVQAYQEVNRMQI